MQSHEPWQYFEAIFALAPVQLAVHALLLQ
jgi:hypothetical protein